VVLKIPKRRHVVWSQFNGWAFLGDRRRFAGMAFELPPLNILFSEQFSRERRDLPSN
jgi:hypothetical protein